MAKKPKNPAEQPETEMTTTNPETTTPPPPIKEKKKAKTESEHLNGKEKKDKPEKKAKAPEVTPPVVEKKPAAATPVDNDNLPVNDVAIFHMAVFFREEIGKQPMPMPEGERPYFYAQIYGEGGTMEKLSAWLPKLPTNKRDEFSSYLKQIKKLVDDRLAGYKPKDGIVVKAPVHTAADLPASPPPPPVQYIHQPFMPNQAQTPTNIPPQKPLTPQETLKKSFRRFHDFMIDRKNKWRTYPEHVIEQCKHESVNGLGFSYNPTTQMLKGTLGGLVIEERFETTA